MRPTRALTFLRVLLVGAVLGLTATSATVTAAAQDAPQSVTPGSDTSFGFSVEPYAEAGSVPRNWLEYQLHPGDTLTDRVSVVNQGDDVKNLYIYPTDAYNASGGSFALRQRLDKSTDVGAWTSLPTPAYTVPAHSAAVIPVTVTVPNDAEPGDHGGAVVAEEIVPPALPGSGNAVQYVRRVATRLYVRVAGPTRAALQVTSVNIAKKQPLFTPLGGGVSSVITYTIKNAGNVRVKLDEINVEVDGPVGNTLKSFDIKSTDKDYPLTDFLLPGNSVTLFNRFGAVLPEILLHAKIAVHGSDPVGGEPINTTRRVFFFAIPWFWLGVLLVIVAVLVWRRRRARGAPTGTSRPTQPPEREEALVGSGSGSSE